jgi:hypothetical protein
MTNDAGQTPITELGRLRELARRRFDEDLPQLLRDHLGYWVAYHGDRQIAIALHTGEIHETCYRLRLPTDEVQLFEIVSPAEEMEFGPMAFD